MSCDKPDYKSLALAAIILVVLLVAPCSGAECKLAWDQPPVAEQVTKWEVWRGIVKMAEVTSPLVVLDLPSDFKSTIFIKAVNSAGISQPALITVVPHTPRISTDLVSYTPYVSKVFFVKDAPKMFFNTSYPTL